jgi:antitoxin VapB
MVESSWISTAEAARLAHETETEAIRRALLERRARLQARAEKQAEGWSLREHLERNVWPLIPATELGRTLTRDEEDRNSRRSLDLLRDTSASSATPR